MHDLIHDLARSVAGSDCCILPFSETQTQMDNRFKKIRFLTIAQNPSSEIPEVLYRVRYLRTLLMLSASAIKTRNRNGMWSALTISTGVDDDVFTKLKLLRVLDLSGSSADEIPNSVSNLKHLRYLNLSTTGIKILPESICSLLNLQTLRVATHKLQQLPKGMKNMSSLRHIDIHGCRLNKMPIGMGQLTSLQTLSDFFVSKEEGSSSMQELGRLNLRGNLSIWNLENTRDETDAKGANLDKREGLVFLNLSWSHRGKPAVQVDHKIVLDALQPHHDLKHLRLCNYGGTILPTWMENPSSNLVRVALWCCEKVEQLPAFGQLHSLRYLQLIGFSALKNIDQAFYGHDRTVIGFPSLKELAFSQMPLFSEWAEVEGRVIFPVLHSLTISKCPELQIMPSIPSLGCIEFDNCNGELLKSVVNLPVLSTFLVSNIKNLKSLPAGTLVNFTSLRKLIVTDCVELETLPDTIQSLTSLEHFTIAGCKNLVSVPDSLCDLNSLRCLEIRYCSELTSLPQRFRDMGSLKSIHIVGCLKIDSWSESGIQSLCALQEFQIEICNKQTDLSIWLRYPKNLHLLRIHGGHELKRTTSDQQLGGNYIRVCCCGDLEILPEDLKGALDLEELAIHNCSDLIALPKSLSNLKSLRYLSIFDCPKMESLPELRSLPILRLLHVTGCSKLEDRYKRNQGEDWRIISHIRYLKIGSSQSNEGITSNPTAGQNQGRALWNCCRSS